MLSSAEWPNFLLPLLLRDYLPQITIFISHDQLIMLCISVGRATAICSRGSVGFEPHRGQRFFLFLRANQFPFYGFCTEGITRDI